MKRTLVFNGDCPMVVVEYEGKKYNFMLKERYKKWHLFQQKKSGIVRDVELQSRLEKIVQEDETIIFNKYFVSKSSD